MRPVGRPGFPNILFSEHSTPPLEALSQGHGVRSGNRILYAMPAGNFFMSVNPKPSTKNPLDPRLCLDFLSGFPSKQKSGEPGRPLSRKGASFVNFFSRPLGGPCRLRGGSKQPPSSSCLIWHLFHYTSSHVQIPSITSGTA